MVNRSVAWTILIALACVVRATAEQAEQVEHATPAMVTIRIYDYALIQPERIARAQELVAHLYRAIGVSIQWADTVEGQDAFARVQPGAARPAPLVDPRELVVMILSPSMAHRTALRKDIVGIAATAPEGAGRFAYVLFDRVRRVATASHRNVMDLMGLVMAHELGHLLLPPGSHSVSGLMQARWGVDDLRADSGQFEFSRTQAEAIRQSLQR